MLSPPVRVLLYVKAGVYPSGQAYHSVINNRLKSLIEHDETSEGTPLLIIDGKPFLMEKVGKMIMSYEGFQIKIVKECVIAHWSSDSAPKMYRG